MGILSDVFHKDDYGVASEEIMALMDDIDALGLSEWEYDFVMDMAYKDLHSDKQCNIIARIYSKYIDGIEREM